MHRLPEEDLTEQNPIIDSHGFEEGLAFLFRQPQGESAFDDEFPDTIAPLPQCLDEGDGLRRIFESKPGTCVSIGQEDHFRLVLEHVLGLLGAFVGEGLCHMTGLAAKTYLRGQRVIAR